MRGDFFQPGHKRSIFLDKLLHGADRNPSVLNGKKKRFFVAGKRHNMLSFFQIGQESRFYFLTEIDNVLIAAFSTNFNPHIVKIHVLNIQSNTFWNTYSCTKQKRKQRQIPYLCLFMKAQLIFCELGTVLHLIKQNGHFIGIQTDNFLFMQFGHRYKGRRVIANQFVTEKIVIKTSEWSQFSCLSPFVVGNFLSVSDIKRQVFHIFFHILPAHFIQNRHRKIYNVHFLIDTISLMEKFKKKPDIICIGQPGSGRNLIFHSTEELLTERGECG